MLPNLCSLVHHNGPIFKIIAFPKSLGREILFNIQHAYSYGTSFLGGVGSQRESECPLPPNEVRNIKLVSQMKLACFISGFKITTFWRLLYFRRFGLTVHTTVQPWKKCGRPEEFSLNTARFCQKPAQKSALLPIYSNFPNNAPSALSHFLHVCYNGSTLKRTHCKFLGPGLSFDMQYGYFCDTSFFLGGGIRVDPPTKYGTSTFTNVACMQSFSFIHKRITM